MCGIAGLHRRNGVPAPNIQRLAIELMVGLEMRGRDATGWLTLEDSGQATIRKDTLSAHAFVRRMKKEPRWAIPASSDIRTLMVHTRFATMGDPRDVRNAHPHACGNVAAVHNGTIWNSDEIFRSFNLPQRTTVDSEAIPALVDAFGWDNAGDALELLEGGAAVSMVCQDRPQELILARVHSFPLYWVETPEFVLWASSPEVIKQAWQKATGKDLSKEHEIKALKDGEMVFVNGGHIEMKTFNPMPAWSSKTWIYTPSETKSKKKDRKALATRAIANHELQRQAFHEKQATMERHAAIAAEEFARSLLEPEGREEEIKFLMSEGLSRVEAEVIVDEGLEALVDYLNDDDDVEEVIIWDDELDDEDVYKRWRGSVETKSPATRAWEELG